MGSIKSFTLSCRIKKLKQKSVQIIVFCSCLLVDRPACLALLSRLRMRRRRPADVFLITAVICQTYISSLGRTDNSVPAHNNLLSSNNKEMSKINR